VHQKQLIKRIKSSKHYTKNEEFTFSDDRDWCKFLSESLRKPNTYCKLWHHLLEDHNSHKSSIAVTS
jgi:hypothetical protein